MAKLEILTYPNPILLARARAVARVSSAIRRLAHNMLETMYAASGIGLAAPQVGVQKRVIVVGVGEDPLLIGWDQGDKVECIGAPAGQEVGGFIWRPTLCNGTGRHSGGSSVSGHFQPDRCCFCSVRLLTARQAGN
jgi:hypothetical protein